MKKLMTYGVAVATAISMLGLAMPAGADGPRPRRGDVMVEEPERYVLNANWVNHHSQDGGSKGQSLALGPDFAFYAFEGWWSHALSDVSKIRASFYTAGATNAGGSPRFSLEVGSADGTAPTGDVIYLDPAHCSNAAAGGWVTSDFTGDVTNCSIFDSRGVQYTSDGVVSAWDMLVADPYYADKTVWFLYLIQDETTGTNYVDRIMLDSAFLTKQP